MMKKIKNFVSFAFIFASFAFLFLFPFSSSASAVTKTAGDLELTGDEPLFSSDIVWHPGLKEANDFQVRNKGSQTEQLMVKAENTDDPDGLAEVFNIVISKDGEVLYGSAGQSLAEFFTEEEVFLSEIDQGITEEYQVEMEMDEQAGNQWQDKSLSFDFKFWFSEEEEAAVTVTGVAGAGAGEAPVCTDSKPDSPTDFTALAGPGAGEVTLSWTAPNPPYTYFLLAYSDTSSWPPKWGNPDVGNITSYTVSGLGSGTYWFWLRAGNGCMPGDFVGPVSSGPITGPPGAPAVVPGFLPGVLGEATPAAELEGELGEGLATEEGEVAGVGIRPRNWWLWLPVGIGGIGGLAFVYFRFFRKR